MFKKEKEFIEFCKKNYFIIFAVIITIFALVIRIFPLKFESDDYLTFLSPWFNYMKANGGLKALGSYPGNYNAPYMTIMAILSYFPIKSLYTLKAVSIFFDFVLALSLAYLTSMLVKKDKKIYALITYTIVLFLPQVITNSSMWAQCDSIYASFAIIALIFLLKEKYIYSFISLGLSFSFKLQFMFILPVFIIMYVCKNKFSILHFLIIPIVDFILCIPAILFGRSIKYLIAIYLGQTTGDPGLVRNYPNIYSLLNNDIQIFKYIGIIITIIILALLLFYFIYKKVKWNNDKIVALTLLVLVVVTYTLPGMHERYVYMGEVLSVVYFLVYKRNLPVILMMHINAIVTYSIYLTSFETNMLPVLAIVYGITIIYFAIDVTKYITNNKEVKYE